MKIKKNGVTINLTESDINKLSKTLLNEQQMGTSSGVFEPNEIKDEVGNHSEWIKYLNSRVDDVFKAEGRTNSKSQ